MVSISRRRRYNNSRRRSQSHCMGEVAGCFADMEKTGVWKFAYDWVQWPCAIISVSGRSRHVMAKRCEFIKLHKHGWNDTILLIVNFNLREVFSKYLWKYLWSTFKSSFWFYSSIFYDPLPLERDIICAWALLDTFQNVNFKQTLKVPLIIYAVCELLMTILVPDN